MALWLSNLVTALLYSPPFLEKKHTLANSILEPSPLENKYTRSTMGNRYLVRFRDVLCSRYNKKFLEKANKPTNSVGFKPVHLHFRPAAYHNWMGLNLGDSYPLSVTQHSTFNIYHATLYASPSCCVIVTGQTIS